MSKYIVLLYMLILIMPVFNLAMITRVNKHPLILNKGLVALSCLSHRYRGSFLASDSAIKRQLSHPLASTHEMGKNVY